MVVDHRIDPDGIVKPHLTKHEGRWTIMWHRQSDYFIWSAPKNFADACRYLKLCGWPAIGGAEGDR
jgi:hypothetical protein